MHKALYGDWNKAIDRLENLEPLMDRNLSIATKRNAIQLRDEMKKTINRGRPEWEPLKPATIKRKGSSKPLIDTADMLNSINTQDIDAMTSFIGVPRGAVGKKTRKKGKKAWILSWLLFGKKSKTTRDLVRIAAVHVFGSNKQNIPPRDFITPAFNAIKDKFRGRWLRAAHAALEGKVYNGD